MVMLLCTFYIVYVKARKSLCILQVRTWELPMAEMKARYSQIENFHFVSSFTGIVSDVTPCAARTGDNFQNSLFENLMQM